MSRPGTPTRRGPPPLPISPAKSPPNSSPLRNSYLGYDSESSVITMAEDYLLSGTQYGSPPKVFDSPFPSNVAADSSSVAAFGSKLEPEELKQIVTPSSPGREARYALAQTAAAAKYGRHTGSASDGADIRWYFCKTPLRPNEAAAQVPASEVVGKGDYFRFSLRDSLALEASFVQQEEELVSAWWKEYAEVSAGPTNPSGALSCNLQVEKEAEEEQLRSRNSASDGGAGQRGPGSAHSDFDDDDNEESVGVLVKGGLYEVDLMRRRCIPVYWRGEHRRVLRGHWYVRKGGLDWLPLREDVSEQLEIAYRKRVWRRRKFQPSGLYAARVDLTGITLGLHALFMGEDDSWDAALAVDASGISAILGFQGSGVKLRRGFARPDSVNPTQDELRQRKEEELDDYATQVPVRHVVFMVHGIGQRLEKANLVDDVCAFRQTVTALSEQHLTAHQRNAQRILFVPCQWRRELKLGGEVAMEQVTLDGVRALRTMITATVHDVLYYMSPVYCQDIIDSVTRSLNRLYNRFIKRNPSFDGKVSLYGHSLGSVLTYDILCHQDTLQSLFPVHSINAAIKRNLESEDDMPKIDRLPSVQDHDLVSGGETSIQDMFSFDNTLGDSCDVNTTDIPTNETSREGEDEGEGEESSTESDKVSATEIENVREPDNSDGNFISDEDRKVSLPSDLAIKGNSGALEEHDIAQGRSESSKEDDVAQEHTKISEEDIAQEHAKFSEEDEIAQEHSKISEEDEIAQENTEPSVEEDSAHERRNALKEEEIAQEHRELFENADCLREHTAISEETEASEVKGADKEEVVEDEEENDVDGKEDGKVVEDDVQKNANDVVEDVQKNANDVVEDVEKNANDVEEDVRITEREHSGTLHAANSEKGMSETPKTATHQCVEQEALQDLPADEMERGTDLVDQVMVGPAEDCKKQTEIERLKEEVAALQEKLRLMETEKRVRREAPENFSDSGEISDHSISTNKGILPASVGSVENRSAHPYNRDDNQELRQNIPDNEFGYVRESMENSVSTRKQHRPYIVYPKLKFKVETFYAVGSPLGMFLALRNIRIGLGGGKEYWQDEGIDEEMPACRLLLNIFHPYDPVAYRLEPLVCKEYVDRKPVFVPYHKGGKRIHIGLQEFGEDLSMKSKAFVNSIGAVGTRVAHAFTSRKEDSLTEEEEERNRKKPKTYGQEVMERLTGTPEGRIDNMLQDSTFEHQYISAISSHTGYWQDPDTALFILKHLYRDISLESESDNTATMESVRGEIDDDGSDDERMKPDSTTANSSPVASAQDDWDSGDDDSTSTFFVKEDWLPALSDDHPKSNSNRTV